MRGLIYFLCLFSFVSLEIEGKTIYFGKQIKTSFEPQVLWDEFDLALKESSQSWLWPKSSTVKGEGLKNGEPIQVTYQFVLANPSYRYLLEVNPEEFRFRYFVADEDHPFSGGATITILPVEGGSLLIWKGEYNTEDSGALSRLVFQRFEKRFFKELKENLRANAF